MISLNSQLKCVSSIVTLPEAKQINENQFQPIKDTKIQKSNQGSPMLLQLPLPVNNSLHDVHFPRDTDLSTFNYGNICFLMKNNISLCRQHLPVNSCVLDRKCPFGHAS